LASSVPIVPKSSLKSLGLSFNLSRIFLATFILDVFKLLASEIEISEASSQG